MPGMPEIIIKAPIFARLEAMSRIPGMKDNPMLSAAIELLKDSQNKLIDIAKSVFLYADDKQADHFKKDWLNDPPGGGFWSQQGINPEPIIRAGILLACEKFRDTGLPCEYFWVTSGDNKTARWEISVTVDVDRITIIFHTPQYATAAGATKQSTRTWIVRVENGAVVTRPALEPA